MRFRVIEQDSSQTWASSLPIKLVWTDPPFGTGKHQKRGEHEYLDFNPSVATHLVFTAIRKLHGNLTDDAVVCVCADYRIIHDVIYSLKTFLFFQGEIIWKFGLGRPRTTWWPVRHNTIATFTKSPNLPTFNTDALPREERLAPKKGYEGDKIAGSVWDKTMSNTDGERVGYPNQKPIDIIKPFILAHTGKQDVVADPFMGSGSTGVAALQCGRWFVGQDVNKEAVLLAHQRLRQMAVHGPVLGPKKLAHHVEG